MTASDLVLSGVVTHASPHLSASGRDIYTVLTLNVDTIVSGSLDAPYLFVATPGGYLRFEDGTSATTFTPGMVPLRKADRGVLFLTERDAANLIEGGQGAIWVPVNGLEGYLGVDATDGTVKRLSPVASPAVDELVGRPEREVIEQLRGSAYRKP